MDTTGIEIVKGAGNQWGIMHTTGRIGGSVDDKIFGPGGFDKGWGD